MSVEDGIITTNLVDLRGVSPTDLTAYSADELGHVLGRLRSQIQSPPTAALSGYNGAATVVTQAPADATTTQTDSSSTPTPPSAPSTAAVPVSDKPAG